MLFNSVDFLFFFVIVTTAYFALPHKLRWLLLVGASCFFYMVYIPSYILILIFLILIDYSAGLLIEKATGPRRTCYLWISLLANIGVLAIFKYFNFVNDNLAAFAHSLGWNYGVASLAIVLPIGLSFHTFQSMSYTIEVYRGNQPAERHLGIYALYVLFYPQLVAGPIERPQNLMHQFRDEHHLDYDRITSGLRLMAWGLFKKAVIADRLAIAVNHVYSCPDQFDGLAIAVATVFFAYQIYCDFSGYSDIAIGAARVMGFQLMTNFDCPYQAASITEFWRRWHISLSTWFRDYLYFPLGGNRVSVPRWCVNLLVVFLVSGLWHGAQWTYVVWGALHGGYMALAVLQQQLWARLPGRLAQAELPRWVRMLGTFALVCFAWIFFRAGSLADAGTLIGRLPTGWGHLAHWHLVKFEMDSLGLIRSEWTLAVGLIAFLVAIEWLQKHWHLADRLLDLPWAVRWAMYYGMVFGLFWLGIFGNQEFIYFQF